MANNADGSIVLSVTVDKSGLDNALKQLKSGSNGMNTLNTATKSATYSLKDFAKTLGAAFSAAQIMKFSNEASKLASQQEANLKRLSMLYGENTKQVYDFVNANANAFGMAKSAAYQAAADYGNLFRTFSGGAESAKLTNDMLQATAVIASQTGRTYEDVFAKIRSGLYGNTRAIDDLGITVRKAGLMQTQAFQTVSGGVKHWNDLTDAELQNARALGIIEQTYKLYGNSVIQSTALTRSQFNAAWTDFKATWGTVINGVLIPVMNVLTKIINLLSVGMQAIAKLMGKSVEMSTVSSNISTGSGQMANNIGAAADNQGELTKGIKDTNKELKKTLAGFDELQILQGNDSEKSGGSGKGSGGGAGGGDTGVSTEVPTIDDSGGYDPNVNAFTSAIAGIIEVLVGVGLIALGVMLLMGKPPHPILGLTCILAGLTSIGIGLATLGAAFDASGAQTLLLLITGVTGVLLLTIGVILLFLGNIPWGVGALVGGIALLGYTAYEALTKLETDQILEVLSNIAAFVGGALVAIGILLCFVGSVPWGIGFIIAGAAALAVSMVALVKQDGKEIQDWLEKIFLIASGALLALGILMIALAGPSPLSVGLIAVGAIGLAVAIGIDSTKTKDAVSKFLEDNKALIVGIALAILVIGVILCCTGVALPLGIALIATGAVVLATEAVLNWDQVKEKITMIFDELKEWLKIGMKLVLGVMLCASGVGLPLGIALILSGAGDLEEKVEIVWEKYGDKIKEIFGGIKTWLETWGKLVLGVMLCASGVGLPLGIALMKSGGAKLEQAQDPMWDTFKNKVKEVWDGIKQFWNDHIAKYFKAEWWKELGKTAIKGLANAIISGLNDIIKGINKFGFDIPDILGGGHVGFNIPQIPKLAKGAVIPANKQFLAVLGDQKRGTNIEAPAELIKQMAKEAITEMGVAGTQNQVVREEHYYLDQTELMNVLYKLVKGGERLRGESLVT